MFWTPIYTRLLIGVWFVIGVVFDVWVAARVSNDATLSKQMQLIYFAWPIVAVAWGGLGCHFFVPKGDVTWWEICKPMLCQALGFAAFFVAWRQMK